MTYQIKFDDSEKITDWVCRGLGEDRKWLGRHVTFGFFYNNKLCGGLIFHDYRPQTDIWWTVFSTDKHWCNRQMLRQMFTLAFQHLGCRRVNLLVSKSNLACLNFVQRLGFQTEGLLREFRENGEDCYFLGMLKNECKWF